MAKKVNTFTKGCNSFCLDNINKHTLYYKNYKNIKTVCVIMTFYVFMIMESFMIALTIPTIIIAAIVSKGVPRKI